MLPTTREGLVRAVRKWDVVGMTLNGVIGAGIFGLPAAAFAMVGVYSLAGFVVCGAAALLITLCLAEVAGRFEDTGGPYLYGRKAFGPIVGFQVGWTTWIARVASFAANVNLLPAYLGFFFPSLQAGWGRATVITVVVVVLSAVNARGVRDTARLGNALAIAKLTPLAIFIVVGFFYLQPEAFAAPAELPAFGELSATVMLLLYAFVGFEMTAIPAGEMRRPERDQATGLLVGMGIIISVYLLIQTVAIGTLPGLGESERPLSDAAAQFMGPIGGGLIAAGAIVSILGNLSFTELVAARLIFAMAERREMPRFLAATHPNFHTPHFATYATGAILLILSFSGTFIYAATVSVIARLFGYAVTCLAVPIFRRQAVGPAGGFVVPGGLLVPGVALLLVGWLFSQVDPGQAKAMAIAMLIGFVIYFSVRWSAGARLKADQGQAD